MAALQMAIQVQAAFLVLCVGVSLAVDPPPTVTVDGMTNFTGTTTRSRGNRLIKQYFSIPYAEPPTNELRFLAPVKKNWTENATSEFDASKPGNICTQFVMDAKGSMLPLAQDINIDFLAGLTQDEDCLTLNIHVPEVNGTDPLPVLFFIHGGSFVGGTSQSITPNFFLDEDIILVAPQYRLGPLGFLQLRGSDEIVGNAALLDQLEALKWVHDNIAAFGGDPDSVTLAGNSAGAVCAGLLHISPLTNSTLFQQVIQISGSVTAPFAIDLNAGEKGIAFANAVNCTDEDAAKVVECLQNSNITEILAANQNMVLADLMSAGNGMPNTLPSIQIQGDQKVIDNTAANMLARKEPYLLPTVTGVTRHEGMFPIQIVEMYLDIVSQVTGNTNCIICNDTSLILPLILGSSNPLLIDSIQETYFPDEPYETYMDLYPSFVDFIGSMYFKAPAYDSAVNLGSKVPLYLYSFDHQDAFNYYGVGHAGDMVYLFPNGTNLTSAETEVSKNVVHLYANFVKNGKPTLPDDELQWPAFTLAEPAYMEMNSEFQVKSDFEATYTVSRREGMMKKPTTGAGSHALPSLLLICLFNFLARLFK